MEQPNPSYSAAPQQAVATLPCADCGAPIAKYLISFVNGRQVCSHCAAALNDTSGRKKALLIGAVGIAVVVVIAVVVWIANANLGAKAEIAKSLVRLQAAALTSEPETAVEPYLDREATYNDLVAAAAAAQDPDPNQATVGIWGAVITTAIQSGELASLEGDRAVLRRELNVKMSGDRLTPFVVEYEMRRSGPGDWRITRILNAADVYATYKAASAQSAQ